METYHIISIVLSAICVVAIMLFGIFSDILRESGLGSPYSFSKFQLWLWTMVIIPAFSLNWGFSYLHSGPLTINGTSLILLGISGGATLAAAAVSSAQKSLPPATGLKASLSAKCFWTDILMDDSGNFSLVRLQQLLFTFVFIAIYISNFFNVNPITYPDFDNTAFVLMGISTGTYVLGKSLNK